LIRIRYGDSVTVRIRHHWVASPHGYKSIKFTVLSDYFPLSQRLMRSVVITSSITSRPSTGLCRLIHTWPAATASSWQPRLCGNLSYLPKMVPGPHGPWKIPNPHIGRML